MDDSVLQFYERMRDEYHLLFADWKQEVYRQGEVLDSFIRRHLEPPVRSVLDCTCGIGTQAIGLAARGYAVHATDFTRAAVERAAREARSFGVSMTFDVADIRELDARVSDTFDVVLSCDNALPHLLEDADLLRAARQMRARLRPGGLLLVSIRDYDRLVKGDPEHGTPATPGLPGGGPQTAPELPRATLPRVLDDADGRRVVFQVWDWTADGRSYTVNLFIVREDAGSWRTTHYATRYRALLRDELSEILRAAGFIDVRWHLPAESGFYQPIVTARRPQEPG